MSGLKSRVQLEGGGTILRKVSARITPFALMRGGSAASRRRLALKGKPGTR